LGRATVSQAENVARYEFLSGNEGSPID
jgi:hypothetical protein